MDDVQYFLDRNDIYRDGKLIRIEWHNGKIEFFEEDGSTHIVSVGGTHYWCNPEEQLHRLDGPAVWQPGVTKEWYINGVQYSEDHFRVLAFALHKQAQNF
jgi:hypothetical protein